MADGQPCGRSPVAQDLCVLHLPKKREQPPGGFTAELAATVASKSRLGAGEIDLTGAHFPDISLGVFKWNRPVILRKAVFSGCLDLEGSVFSEDVDFSSAALMTVRGGPTFERKAVFTGASFDGLRLVGAKFLGLADFTNVRVYEDSHISAEFANAAIFDGARFGEIYFDNSAFAATFSCRKLKASILDLSGTRFLGKACFDGLVALHGFRAPHEFGRVTFNAARFGTSVDLSRTIFGECSFADGRFEGAAAFSECRFGASAVFAGVVFSSDADFSKSVFSGLVSFKSAVCAGRFDFSNTQLVHEGAVADFEGVKFEDRSRVHFIGANAGTEFGLCLRLRNTELDKVRFDGVNWRREHGRIVLQDEIDERTSRTVSPTAVASAYRRLLMNFEQSRANEEAEDCLWGLMEMRRRGARSSFTVLILTVYRWASFYGSSPLRGVFVLLALVLVLFPAAYLIPAAGLQISAPATSATGLVPRAQGWGGYAASVIRPAVLHSLEVATFRSNQWFITSRSFGYAISMVETAMVSGQLALTLLAFRRRFGR